LVNTKSPSASERAGLALVRKVVVGDATFTDTGKLPNRHDWVLDHEGQLVAAVEITSVKDRQRRSLAAALNKHWKWLDQVLHQPTLTKRWIVNPADEAMIGDKKVRASSSSSSKSWRPRISPNCTRRPTSTGSGRS
jgi:hypothetical protein